VIVALMNHALAVLLALLLARFAAKKIKAIRKIKWKRLPLISFGDRSSFASYALCSVSIRQVYVL
jgi:hypothetical protein